MKRVVVGLACAITSLSALAGAQPTASSSARTVSERALPTPSTVSPRMQALAARAPAPPPPKLPETPGEWKAIVGQAVQGDLARVAALRRIFDVDVERQEIGGVPCYVITPRAMSARNRNRVLVNVHGGAYVFGPGEASMVEAITLAGFAQMKVIAVDYRMPPDHPFPAAIDDAMAVWRQVSRDHDPRRLAIFGTSTGGALTLSMVQRAKQEGLPLPAAIFSGTPWSDLSKTGDSYFANAGVDNALNTYEGLLEASARLYAGGQDLKDARLSPVYGDFAGFPPTILISGTRDLFLSNTVRVHRQLREAGVVAELEVYEGQSHAQYVADPQAPEAKVAFGQVAKFFDAHLAP